jgi:hypothetical protein
MTQKRIETQRGSILSDCEIRLAGLALTKKNFLVAWVNRHKAEGFFIHPTRAAKLYDRPSSVDRHT